MRNALAAEVSKIHDKSLASRYSPHPQSLSQRARDTKPFSLWEKGGDEGGHLI
jgi:hypothetical protein